MARPKFSRILSPATVYHSRVILQDGRFTLVYQPPDVPGPHIIRLGMRDYVRQHGHRFWIYSPKERTR